MNLQQLSFMTGMSFGVAATTLVGQSLGRKRVDLAREYVRLTLQLNLIVAITVAMVLFFGGELICSLYSDDPVLVKYAADMLKIIALVNPISAARFVYTSGLRGAGDSRFSAVITFVGVLVMRPLVSYILVFPPFPFQLGLAGIWIALSSDGVMAYILSRVRFKKGKWALIKV
jgi:Na+-driven multidrug efflux pump